MRHPYEKFIRIELFSIGLSVFIGIFAFIKSYTILMFICFYFISLGLVAEAIVAWSTYQKEQAIKSMIRAVVIFLISTYLFWYL